jgi:F-type H+-transporting ATPase subunit gamma
MAQEREIASRIASLGELSEIISAIRAIAASQMQQALRSLDAVRRYSDLINEALADAAQMVTADSREPASTELGDSALVAFFTEHGLCGSFNEQLARAAEEILAEDRPRSFLIAAGSRGGQSCQERGLTPKLVLPMATHIAGVSPAARRLAKEVYSLLNDGSIARLQVIYTETVGGERMHIERSHLLPLEAPTAQLQSAQLAPLTNLNPRRLFDEIVNEYLFAALEKAATLSFFSENSVRFRTMEAARHNIENKSEELTRLARRLRQEAVTTEILDLISAMGAVSLV